VKDKIEHIKHLTIDQISEYLKGKLDSREKFAIERHLLDCSLCSEALEGYEADPANAKEHVEELKGLLTKRTQKEGGFVFWQYRYYGIAASLALLVVAVFSIFEIDPLTDDPEIALNSENQSVPESSLISDTLLVDHQETAIEDLEKSVIELKPSLVIELEPKVDEVVVPPALEASDRSIALSSGSENLGAGNPGTAAVAEKGDTFEGVGDLIDEDVAVIEESEAELSIVTLQASPQASQALQRSLSSKAFTNTRNEALRAGSTVIESKLEPQPQIGMMPYQKYLKDSLQYPSDAKENLIEGEVELIFDVEVNGSITDIQVVRSLGSGCDEEAIRLLNNGPDWFPARDNGIPVKRQATITIRFGLASE